MRHMMRSAVLLSVVGVLAGCDLKEVYPTEAPQVAGVRFINAVPDTAGAFGMDLRWVDLVENNHHFRQNFRNGPATTSGVTGATGVQYKPTAAGQRRFKIFLNDTLQAVAQVVIKDTTVNLEAGQNYTALLLGEARTGTMRLAFFEEAVAAPAAGKTAVRVINATGAAIDVRHYKSGTTAPATATFAGVAAYTASAHLEVDTATYRYNVQPAGGGTALFADGTFLVGAQASSSAGAGGKLDIEAIPGTAVAGSAVTVIVFPRSTAGARTPQLPAATWGVPQGVSVWDRRPPYIQ